MWNLDGSKSMIEEESRPLGPGGEEVTNNGLEEFSNSAEDIDYTSVSAHFFSGYHPHAAALSAELGKNLGNKMLQLGAKAILLEVKASGAIKPVNQQ